MSLELKFDKGKINEVSLHRPQHMGLNDCRGGREGFVCQHISDGDVEINLYLPTAMAGELFAKLAKLYVPEPQAERSDDV